MTTNTTTRGPKAGQLQAGDTIDDGQNLPDLLAFNTTAEGVRVGDLLRERLASAEAATVAHAAGAEDAQLRGDVAERAHADESARLSREVARVRLAIEKADAHLEEVAAAERQADARAKLKAATKAAARAETIAADEYPAAARAVAALLDELAAVQREVVEARCAAHDAGLGDEAAALQLPHERRSCSEISEEREVVSRQRPAGVYTADGRRIDGNGDGALVETRRRERVVLQARFLAPDLTTALAVLPDPAGGRLLDRSER